MIEEIEQPDKKAGRSSSDVSDEVHRAVKRLEDMIRFYAQDQEGGMAGTAHSQSHQAQASPVGLSRKSAKTAVAPNARASLVLRGVEAISREIGHLRPELVMQLLQSSDPKLLAGLARASLEDTPIDRVERMTLRGSERFQKLIENAGGSVSSRWVAELLDTTEEAVRKRAQRGALIGRHTSSGDWSFPRFQFDEAQRRLLPGLTKLRSKAHSWAPEELIRFLLARHEPQSTDDTPLKLLQRGEIDRVLELAGVYMQQRP